MNLLILCPHYAPDVAPTGEVMTEEGKVIPGLYAAGRTSSGFPAAGYNSGMAVADCTFFGRMAGKAAAAADPAS